MFFQETKKMRHVFKKRTLWHLGWVLAVPNVLPYLRHIDGNNSRKALGLCTWPQLTMQGVWSKC